VKNVFAEGQFVGNEKPAGLFAALAILAKVYKSNRAAILLQGHGYIRGSSFEQNLSRYMAVCKFSKIVFAAVN